MDKPGSLGLLLRRIAADEEEVAGFNNIKRTTLPEPASGIILIGAKSSQSSPSPSASCRYQFHRQLFLALRRGRTTWKEAFRIRLKTISSGIRLELEFPPAPAAIPVQAVRRLARLIFTGSIILRFEADVKKEGKERTKRIRSFLEFVFLDYEIDVNILLIFFAFSGTIK